MNEAYLRLVDAKGFACKDRAHFFALSAQIMRRILVDAARARASAKRGGNAPALDHSEAISLDDIAGSASQKSAEVLALDQALDDLARVDERKARVIELRFFGGLRDDGACEIRRVLKPGGRVLVVDFGGAEQQRGFLAHFHQGHGHVKPAEVTALLNSAGLNVVDGGAVGIKDLHFTLAMAPCGKC